MNNQATIPILQYTIFNHSILATILTLQYTIFNHSILATILTLQYTIFNHSILATIPMLQYMIYRHSLMENIPIRQQCELHGHNICNCHNVKVYVLQENINGNYPDVKVYCMFNRKSLMSTSPM